MSATQANSQNAHGDNIFVYVEQYFPKDGKLDDVLSIAKESAKGLRDAQGLLQYKVLKSVSKNGPVCSILTWESISDFKTFNKSDAVKEILKSDSMKNMIDWTSDVKMFQFDLFSGWHQ